MLVKMLNFAALAICGLGLLANPASAASDYPNRPITVIDAFPAGGGLDILARVVGKELKKSLGQPIVVENKPGAGGAIGANTAAAAEPNGYTLLVTSSALTMVKALRPQILHFSVKDGLEPIALAATVPSVVVVNSKSPLHSLGELIAYAKERPDRVTVGSSGVGSPAFFFEKLFSLKAGIQAVDVPFRGPPQIMNAQISNEITFHFAILNSALPQIQAGSVRGLAVTSDQRLPKLPDIPTMAEAGVPIAGNQWFGFFAPAHTPAPIVARLTEEIHKALHQPSVREALDRVGMTVVDDSNPTTFSSFLREDLSTWQKVVKQSHIAVQ